MEGKEKKQQQKLRDVVPSGGFIVEGGWFRWRMHEWTRWLCKKKWAMTTKGNQKKVVMPGCNNSSRDWWVVALEGGLEFSLEMVRVNRVCTEMAESGATAGVIVAAGSWESINPGALDTKKKGEFPSGEEAEEKEESLLGVDSCGRKLAVRRQELWKTTRVIFLCHRKVMHPLTSHSWTDPIASRWCHPSSKPLTQSLEQSFCP